MSASALEKLVNKDVPLVGHVPDTVSQADCVGDEGIGVGGLSGPLGSRSRCNVLGGPRRCRHGDENGLTIRPFSCNGLSCPLDHLDTGSLALSHAACKADVKGNGFQDGGVGSRLSSASLNDDGPAAPSSSLSQSPSASVLAVNGI